MANKVLIDRALLQDLIDDVSDYAASREFKERETKWRTELLEKASALLAAGASEGQAEPVAWRVVMEGQRGERQTVILESLKDAQNISDFGDPIPLYEHPSAELTALRERIAGMEKDAELKDADGEGCACHSCKGGRK